MAGFGNLGVANGAARAAPTSQVVDYMPSATRWRDDWDQRYQYETDNPSQVTGLISQSPYPAAAADQLGQDMWQDSSGRIHIGAPTPGINQAPSIWDRRDGVPMATGAPGVQEIWAEAPGAGGSTGLNGGIYAPGGSPGEIMGVSADSQQQQQGWQQVRSPNYSKLLEERDRMLPIMERQQTAQQAYDSMSGWGQTNGIISPFYSDPNFGQVNGYFGQDRMKGVNANANLDMGWAGVGYDGGLTGLNAAPLQNLGVYSPARPRPQQWLD